MKKQIVALMLSTVLFLSSTAGTIAWAQEEKPVTVSRYSASLEEQTSVEAEENQMAGTEEAQVSEKNQEPEGDAQTEEVSEEQEAVVQNGEDTSRAVTGATVWLDTTAGSDTAGGASEAAPVKTLDKALELAGEGGTIIVTGSGSGIMISGESVTLENITILRGDNFDPNLELIYVLNGGELTINHATIDGGNVATEEIGIMPSLVQVSDSRLTINDGAVLRNSTATVVSIIASDDDSTVIMNGGEICDNKNLGRDPLINFTLMRTGTTIASFTMNGGSIHDNTTHYMTIRMSGSNAAEASRQAFYMNGGTITGNTVTIGGAVGGIYNGTFAMTGGTISGNTSSNGSGTLRISGDPGGSKVKISGGTITGNTGKNGGGIWLENGELTLDGDAEISGNQVSTGGGGGGILLEGGTLDLVNGSITGNQALPDNGGGGGGILLKGGTLNMSGGTVSDNQSATGGGIEAWGQSTVNITGGTVSNNHAKTYGGAVYIHDETAVANISGGVISGNTSPWAGGCFIWNNGKMNISGDTLITENETTGVDQRGGGIYLYGGTLNMTGGTVSKNRAVLDGGGVQIVGGTATIEKGVVITENTAGRNGGGIAIARGTLTVDGATISNNHAVSDGGGITTQEGDTIIRATTVSGNIAGNRGGGINSRGNGTLNIENGTVITKNTAAQGGGIDSCDHPVSIDGTVISENVAVAGSGISVWDNGEVTIKGETKINGNSTTGTGKFAGAVYVWGSSATEAKFIMESGSITNNTAKSEHPAGLSVVGATSSAVADIKGGEISGNTNENGENLGIKLFKNGDQNGILRLSGSPTIKDEIFLNDDQDPAAKVEINGAFTPNGAIKINDTSWTDNRTIVTYAQGLAANADDFTPATALDIRYIIKDGQDLKSMNRKTLSLPTGTLQAVDGKTDIHEGAPVTLEATAMHEAEGRITYQFTWFKDGKELANVAEGRAASDTRQLTVTEAGTYSVKVTASDGTETTEAVEIGTVKVTESAHAFGEWVVVKNATETEKGLRERTCSICGMKEQQEIPATGKKEDPTPADPTPGTDDKKDEAKEETEKKNDSVTTKTETTTKVETVVTNGVRTGDQSSAGAVAGVMALAFVAGAGVMMKRNKNRKAEKTENS